jgi:MFS family permease
MALGLPRTVIVLGLVSLFNDLASEMVVPLIPILLATVLGAGPVALGLVEGVADAVASFLKLWSGRHSDWLGGQRKGLTLYGYALSNVARPLLGLAGNWGAVLLLRGIDRVGKGLRSAPRDALVTDTTPPEIVGYAYGYHRALDNAGALGGSLVAAAVLAWSAATLPDVILWSAVPGIVAVLLLAFGIRETTPKTRPMDRSALPALNWAALSANMRGYLMVLALFTFARASETFIVLRGHELGINVVHLLLLWAVLNLAKAVTSTWGGRLADQFGRGGTMLVSWAAYAVSYLSFGQVGHAAGLWVVTVGYGLFAGLSEGAERALISDFSKADERGTAFGWYHLMVGITAIPAGLVFGGIWHYRGAAWAFSFAGLLAAVSTLALRFRVWPHLAKGNNTFTGA